MNKINGMDRPEYIPILKWQLCEQLALRELRCQIDNQILPCIEIRQEKSSEDFPQSFQHYWNRPALVDYSDPSGRIIGKRRNIFNSQMDEIVRLGLPLVPVLNPEDLQNPSGNELISRVNEIDSVCLRLNIDLSQQLNFHFESVLKLAVALESKRIKIILDLGITPEANIESINSIGSLANKLLSNLDIDSLHISSGAYPKSLKKIGVGVGEIKREDWLFWNEIVKSNPEVPLGYSDYGSVYPLWDENDDGPKIGPLAIRYAIEDKWLVVRGGNEKDDQANNNLAKLFFLNFGKYFEGRDFSWGDMSLELKSNNSKPSYLKQMTLPAGNVLEALSHHLAFVIKKQYSASN